MYIKFSPILIWLGWNSLSEMLGAKTKPYF